MEYEIMMPRLGSSEENATIVRWLKAEGDPIAAGEVILEVEAEKATVEVEAAYSGRLHKIVVPEGESVPVGTVIAIVEEVEEE
ncbi:MAG: biotin/lipoyl-containing protein [Chloroflexota bacterium]